MLSLVLAAARFQRALDDLGLPNCVIGGLALQAWGEVRTTKDADFTVLTDFDQEASKVEQILRLVTPRRPDAFQFAMVNRVVVGYLDGDVPVDIGMGGFEFERELVHRAVQSELAPGVTLRIVTAEDLIVMKVFAGRDQDWIDVKGIIIRQGGRLNWPAIDGVIPSLLEMVDDPGRLDRLHRLRGQNG